MLWDDFVQLFIEKHASRKPATTLEFYERGLRNFTMAIQPKKLSRITVATLEDFADLRLQKGLAAATVNRDLRHLRAALRWARRRGFLSVVPDFGSVFIKEHRKKPTIIPEDDFLAMVSALKSPIVQLKKRPANWWRVFLYLAHYLGVRRGELLSLSWDDVKFDTLEVRIQAPTSKSRRERVIPMARELAELLKKWRSKSDQAASSDPVLPWPYNTYRQLYADWHRI